MAVTDTDYNPILSTLEQKEIFNFTETYVFIWAVDWNQIKTEHTAEDNFI